MVVAEGALDVMTNVLLTYEMKPDGLSTIARDIRTADT